MTAQPHATQTPLPRRQLILLSVPALIIGVASAVVLWLLDEVAELIQHLIWTSAPGALGIADDSRWWTFLVLTLIGAATGLVIWLVPGHAGPDSATTELASDALPIGVVPGLALAVLLTLAGGVSLGPENPIIAINASISVALLGRLWPKIPTKLVVMLAVAATIGALFGTPVAAALIFTGMVAALPGAGALWDKLFLPLVAAGAGSITMLLLGAPSMSFGVPAYPGPRLGDLLSGAIIASAAVLVSMLAVLGLRPVHRFFHSLRHPLVYVTLGGAVLGLLGALGGRITLFKGLTQTSELIAHADAYGFGTLLAFALIKIAALLISASAGFRGGRIFPAVFIGAALGLAAHELVPSVPVALAVGCGAMGATFAIARDGWVALFIGFVASGSLTVLPLLCLISLPVWLIVARAPEMVVHEPPTSTPARPLGGSKP